MLRLLIVALAALLLAGCGSGGPVKRVFPPEARLQELRLDGDRATVLMRVQSFSTVPSELQSYALTLELAGRETARLEGRVSTVLLPQAAEVVELAAALDADGVARARQALEGGTALRYRLHGTITVEPSGRAYPIDYSSALSPAPGLDGVLR